MVLTFNKRELLEFANWNIKQERLPNRFRIKIPKENSLMKPVWDAYDLIDPEYQKSHNHSDSLGNKEGHYFCVQKPHKDLPAHCVNINPNSSIHIDSVKKSLSKYVELTFEEFNKFNDYEKIDLFTNIDVNMWLKYEKNISFNPVVKNDYMHELTTFPKVQSIGGIEKSYSLPVMLIPIEKGLKPHEATYNFEYEMWDIGLKNDFMDDDLVFSYLWTYIDATNN